MKKILFLFFTLLSLTVSAQETTAASALRIGYLSYETTLKSMPEYAVTQDSIQKLNKAYEQEVKRTEDEFNQKYESFLEGQREFPRTILLKRQNELQDLMQRNVDYRVQARREIQEAEQSLMAPLHERLSLALSVIARQRGLALVVNTDSKACPFIEPALSINVQLLVADYLSQVGTTSGAR